MKIMFYLPLFMFLMQISNGIRINEVMADPVADETLNEWIELFNNESNPFNVSGFIIGDDKGNDTIEGGLYGKEGTIIEAYGFAIITDSATRAYNNFNASPDAVRLYVGGSSIGNGLSNEGEMIYLYDRSSNLIDKLAYNETDDGLSWAYLNGTLHKSNPSMGFSNDGKIITGEACDYSVEIILAKAAFQNSSEFSFKVAASKIKGPSTNFTVRAKIESLNGNVAREYHPFTNETITTRRTSAEYSPELEEGNSYVISSNITVQCNDSNHENNFDARIITIRGKPMQEQSSIDIAAVYDLGSDKTAKFGQVIRVNLNIYKGNTNKESVAVWVENKKGNKLSKQSKTSLGLKYSPYSLTLPVQIDPNCDEEFENGNYIIKAQGIDSEDEEEIEIGDLTNSLCEAKALKNPDSSPSAIKGKSLPSKKFNFELKEFEGNIELGKEFTTKIILDNNNNHDIKIKAWSYVYRGSKSYSGEREENKNEFILKANSLQVIELSNLVKNAEPGDYKLKVVVNKDTQKTNDEITTDIVVNENNLKTENTNVKAQNYDSESLRDYEIGIAGSKGKNGAAMNKITGNILVENNGIVYKSTTEKTKSFIPIFLIILSVLLNVVLIWKR